MAVFPTIGGRSLPWSPAIMQVAKNTNNTGVPYSPEYLRSINWPGLQAQNDSYSPSTGGGNGGGGGSAAPAVDAGAIAAYDQAIAQANAGIGRLGEQESIGLQNVAGDYTSNLNRLLNAKNTTQKQYEGNVATTKVDNVKARSNVDFETGQRANALQRLLGSKGSGSSSASRFAAPYAAAVEGTQQLNQVGDAFQKNMNGLDTSWDTYQTNWNQSKDDLEAQKVNNENSLRAEVASKRAALLNNLAQLQTQRTQAAGGSPAASVAAAQPFLNQVNSLYGQIDQLGRQFQGRVNVANPTYVAPDLSKYDYNARTQVQSTPGSAQTQAINPYLNLLLNGKDKKQLLA